jgi:HK97 family phage portal protein
MSSLLGRIFKSRDKPGGRPSPSNALNGGAYSFFFGGTAAGKVVNERSAMQMTAVYACVRILSESVASLPLHVYLYNDSGDPSRAGSKEKALMHPLYGILHDEPNPEMSAFSFRETLMIHLLLFGNGYAQIIRNGRGEVVALYPLMPDRMAVDRDSRGRLFYEYTRSDSDVNTLGKKSTVVLAPSDVLHIPGLGFDGLVGYSPIAMAKQAIGMGLACDEYGATFFQNGAQPGGVLEHPGVVKDPKRVRESWNAIYQGSANAHRVAVLEEGMALNLSPSRRNKRSSWKRASSRSTRSRASSGCRRTWWATLRSRASRTSSSSRWSS